MELSGLHHQKIDQRQQRRNRSDVVHNRHADRCARVLRLHGGDSTPIRMSEPHLALCSSTSNPFPQTTSEATLTAILAIFLAVTDLIPLLEGNTKYFHTTSRVRLLVAVILHILAIQIDNSTIAYYAIMEEVTNFCYMMEHTLTAE